MWRTRSTITGPGKPSSAPSSPATAPRRWPGCAHWPPASTPPAWWARRTARPGRARCSSTPAAVRSGPAWAANCWPTSRLSPTPSPNWNRYSSSRPGSRCTTCIANGKELVGIEQIQLGLIGMQLALTALWRSYGVQPDVVIGHSMGEVAAAVVAGALTPAEGLRVTATRSRLMAPLSGQGGMALLELDAAATEALIADYPQVTLGIYNSPRQTVIAGPTDADRRVDRRGRRAEPVRQPGQYRSGPAQSGHGCAAAGDAFGVGRSGPADADHSDHLHHLRRPRQPPRSSTPSTGPPTCATRCVSSRPSPPPGPTTTPSSRSARTRC